MSIAAAAGSLTFETSLEVYPAINRLALDFVRGADAPRRFLRPLDLAAIRPRRRDGIAELAAGLIRANRGWGNEVESAIGQWTRGESATLIAGQQVGFAGGPLYTLVKLASLLRLQERLTARGVPATVFFWLATEDHDFAEISRLGLVTRDGIREIRAREQLPGSRVVGPLAIPESLRQQFVGLLGSPSPPWLASGLTFRDSFAKLIVSVLGSGSVVLVDALMPELRRAGSALFRSLLEHSAELQWLVDSRSRDIERAGYSPQIEPGGDGDYPFLYMVSPEGERHSIRHKGETLMVGTGKRSPSDLLRLAEEQPESISTGVLARPLLQDTVFAPDVFVGGPAEVAYYAQVTALHERLGINHPQVALRGHALVAPSKTLRALEKYGLKPEELFLPIEELIARHETQAVGKLESMVETAGNAIEGQLEQVRSFVVSFDSTMARAIDHSLRKIRYQLHRVGQKGKRAIARSDVERHRAISRLIETLVPHGEPQDRVVGWIGYWLQYGDHLMRRLVSEVEPGSDRLKIIGL